jgi:hypothetical protein
LLLSFKQDALAFFSYRAAGTLEIDDIFALNNVNQRAFSLY